MHPKLLEAMVTSVRTRKAQGDCPVEPQLSVENLEDAVTDLADDIAAFKRALSGIPPHMIHLAARMQTDRERLLMLKTEIETALGLVEPEGR